MVTSELVGVFGNTFSLVCGKMNSARKLLPLARVYSRQFFGKAAAAEEEVIEVPSKYFKKLKENQKRFQMDDGYPDYLKGGPLNRLLVKATIAFTIFNTLCTFKIAYDLASK